MIMQGSIGNADLNGDDIEEWRIGQRCTGPAKVIRDMKFDAVGSGDELGTLEKRLVCSSIPIGHDRA